MLVPVRQWEYKTGQVVLGFLVSKETVVLRRWGRSKQKFGFMKQVDKCWITTVKGGNSTSAFTVVIQHLSTRFIKPNKLFLVKFPDLIATCELCLLPLNPSTRGFCQSSLVPPQSPPPSKTCIWFLISILSSQCLPISTSNYYNSQYLSNYSSLQLTVQSMVITQ